MSGEIKLEKAGYEHQRRAREQWLAQLSDAPLMPEEQVALIALGEQLGWRLVWGRDFPWFDVSPQLLEGEAGWLALAEAGPWRDAHAVLLDARAAVAAAVPGLVRQPPFNPVLAEHDVEVIRKRLFETCAPAIAHAVWTDVELRANAALAAQSSAALAWALRLAEGVRQPQAQESPAPPRVALVKTTPPPTGLGGKGAGGRPPRLERDPVWRAVIGEISAYHATVSPNGRRPSYDDARWYVLDQHRVNESLPKRVVDDLTEMDAETVGDWVRKHGKLPDAHSDQE